MKKLARADAFGSLRLPRPVALWQAMPSREPVPLFARIDVDEPSAPLPPTTPLKEVVADYDATGLSLRQHPISFVRARFEKLGVVPARALASLASGSKVKVAGIVILRQRPGTANGITFVTLEDESGMANLIVRPQVWERHRRIARNSSILLAHGHLQRESNVIHVLVTRLEDFSTALKELNSASRDFR